VTAARLLAVAAAQAGRGGWPETHRLAAYAVAVALSVLLAGLAAMAIREGRVSRRAAAAGAAALLGMAVVAGWPLQRHYLSKRYAGAPPPPDQLGSGVPASLAAVFRWSRGLSHTRIGIVNFYLQYPFYGEDLSNRVQYVGRKRPHGGFAPVRGCSAWRAAVNAGRYRYVVTAPPGYPFAPPASKTVPAEERWTRTRGTTEVLRVPGPLTVFRIDGRLGPAHC
jgi:hypothetical protein